MQKTFVRKDVVQFLSEYSVPLMLGVIVALIMANAAPSTYSTLVEAPLLGIFESAPASSHDPSEAAMHSHGTVAESQLEQSEKLGGILGGLASKPHEHATSSHAETAHHSWGHFLSLHFLINDIFMVFFFGVAAKEITEACLPGGALNPPSKAINPLCGTIGGVVGPIAAYFGLNMLFGQPAWTGGWGIPTATDIALAWLVAKLVFGKGHPAISFLLLLAVADDAIGLAIIAFAYPDPAHPTEWLNALWIVPGMLAAFTMRRMQVRSWIPYIAIGGVLCWWGLFSAHLHPALALVFVVPFIPGPDFDLGLYSESASGNSHDCSPLEQFEHATRVYVDYGLFFFAFANAGVALEGVSGLTGIVLLSLIVGKTLGISLFSAAADSLGFALPSGMNRAHLIVAGMIAGVGLTVALFVSGQAFTVAETQGAAKMGALLSVFAAPLALITALVLGVAKWRVEAPAVELARARADWNRKA